MNVKCIFFWIRLAARGVLGALDWLEGPAEGGKEGDNSNPEFKPERIQLWPEFKPERIQFWLKLIAQLVLAVVAATEETGKSGERSGVQAPSSQEVDG